VKLKRLPEDFRVTELSEVQTDGGEFALYRLRKTSIGTLEAIEELQRRWNLQRNRVSWGGLKDRHAVTEQFVTVRGGPQRNHREKGIELTWLGRTRKPFTPADIHGNRFEIVIRDLSTAEALRSQTALGQVAESGVPNYFDDQRFGSVGESGEFIGRPWCQGDYERALWLALAEPHPDDPGDEREQKRILRDHWGRWIECKAALDRSHRRSVVTYLADRPPEPPFDFRGAFARIRVDLRGLYLSAYQSALWNRMLAAFIRDRLPPDALCDVPLQLGPAPFFLSLTPEQRSQITTTLLPLPSARQHLEPGPMLDLMQSVLAREGLELRELRVKYPRDSFFSKGERRAVTIPAEAGSTISPDELYQGRSKLTMTFILPRGAYATIIVKRITDAAGCEVER
jgi:tRNA pseudouridine13 synthase